MSIVAYEIVDVFTDRPFTGNPLAVVYGAADLAHDQMQTLAREFNLSETVFVLEPSDPSATYRARIFTGSSELPFAGHPSVGAAVTSMRRGLFGPGDVIQDGHAHARVFAPGDAVWEDPATGSAALGLGVWLVAAGRLPPSGTSSYRVHQGVELKRPSVLDCTVTATAGAAVSATVTGHVVPIAKGEIAVPPFVG